ncbi:MAG: branched-chain amino acid ABC transporter permease [Eubacteriales bacterium]
MKNRIFNTATLFIVSIVVFVILVALQYFKIISEYNGMLLTLAGIYVIVALSLNLITGITGQFALGQAGFMCVGAYTTAIAIIRFSMPIPIALIMGGIMSALFGLAIGIPALRLRGDYLAITTLGFGEIIRVIMVNLDSLTGGAAGLKGIPPFSNTGNFVMDAIIEFTWVYVCAIIVMAVLYNLVNSSHGRAILSIREDEIASSSMGINVAYYKVFAFALSSFIAGIGGGLYAIFFGYLNPAMFGWLNSVNFVVILVLGGMGSLTGTIIAAVIFTYLQEWLRVFADFRLVVFGLALILLMIFWPRGLMGNKEISITGFFRRLLSGQINLASIKSKILLLKNIGKKKNNREVK